MFYVFYLVGSFILQGNRYLNICKINFIGILVKGTKNLALIYQVKYMDFEV